MTTQVRQGQRQQLLQAGTLSTECNLHDHVQQVSVCLQAEFHAADPDIVAALVRDAFDRTRDARVQQFRAVLAERQVRDELRRIGDDQPDRLS